MKQLSVKKSVKAETLYCWWFHKYLNPMNTEAGIHFTPREMEVIRLILLKYYRKRIGVKLHITTGTVDNHIKHMFLKINCHSIGELIIYLLSHGFAVNPKGTIVTFKGMVI